MGEDFGDKRPLAPEELPKMDAYRRGASYRSVGRITLGDNPLLPEPMKLEQIKPRLLGHWGTTPGLNFICVRLNRVVNITQSKKLFTPL
jgi:xylulose-5-phosphate/fructose-6-phosphate phosphoketolase